MFSLHHIKGDLPREDKIEILKSAFKEADKEEKGKLSASEFKEVLIAVTDDVTVGHDVLDGLTLRAADRDGDGMVDCDELIKLFMFEEKVDPEEKMKTWFRMFDVNRNGQICKKELENLNTFLGDGEIEPIDEETREMINKCMKEFDADGDGVLNYEEFSKLMGAIED